MSFARKKPVRDADGRAIIGRTFTVRVADVTVHVTVNTNVQGRAVEVFGKADCGWQGWLDTLMETVSLALQFGTPMGTILHHWRYQRFEPMGIVGQGVSIPDAIAKRLFDEGYGKEV